MSEGLSLGWERTKILADDEVRDILFTTYRFSQGEDELQGNFIKLVASLHPKCRVRPELTTEKFIDKYYGDFFKFVTGKGHKEIDEHTIITSLRTEFAALKEALNAEHVDDEDAAWLALDQTLSEDQSWFEKGRKHSFFITYILEGRKPPHNKFFGKVIKSIQDELNAVIKNVKAGPEDDDSYEFWEMDVKLLEKITHFIAEYETKYDVNIKLSKFKGLRGLVNSVAGSLSKDNG